MSAFTIRASVLHAKIDFAPKPVITRGTFIFEGHKLHDRLKTGRDPQHLFCSVPWKPVVFGFYAIDGIYYHNQTSIVSVSLRTHDDGCSSFPSVLLRTVLIKSLQVRGSQCLGLGEAPIRKRSWPSTRLLLLLMIPSLTFWGDLPCPLTPVGRGKLKQLKGPQHGGLSFKPQLPVH